MPKNLSVLSDKEILRFAQNDFLFGTEIFAKYFPYFSPRNFFSMINVTGDVNIKPSKDTDSKLNRIRQLMPPELVFRLWHGEIPCM